jgi:type IV secretory pathway VirB2 component (pilin)
MLKYAPALIGGLQLASVYVLARKWYNEQVALVAATLVAFADYSVFMTSWMVPEIVGIVLLVLAIYFFVRATQEELFAIPCVLTYSSLVIVHHLSQMLAILATIAICILMPRGRRRRAIALLFVLILISYAWWAMVGSTASFFQATLSTFLNQIGKPTSPQAPSLGLMSRIGQQVTSLLAFDQISKLTIGGIAILGVALAWRLKKISDRLVLAWLGSILSFLAVALFVFTWNAFPWIRLFEFAYIPSSVLDGAAILFLAHRVKRRTLLAVIIIVLIGGMAFQAVSRFEWSKYDTYVYTDDELLAAYWVKDQTPRDAWVFAPSGLSSLVFGLGERNTDYAIPEIAVGAKSIEGARWEIDQLAKEGDYIILSTSPLRYGETEGYIVLQTAPSQESIDQTIGSFNRSCLVKMAYQSQTVIIYRITSVTCDSEESTPNNIESLEFGLRPNPALGTILGFQRDASPGTRAFHSSLQLIPPAMLAQLPRLGQCVDDERSATRDSRIPNSSL